MFGIGLPEMIVIFVVALIVVGPDKLPDLARSLAKGLMEMKKTVNQLKENLTDEEEALNEVQQDLRKTANELKERMLDTETQTWSTESTVQDPYTEKTDANEQEELIELSPEDKRSSEELRPWEVDAQAAPAEAAAEDNEQEQSTEEQKTGVEDK